MEKQEKHRRRQLGRMSRRAFALYLLNLLLFVIVYTAVLYVGYVLVHLHVWQCG